MDVNCLLDPSKDCVILERVLDFSQIFTNKVCGIESMLELAGLELLGSLNLDLAILSLAFLPTKLNKGEGELVKA